ncbi:MAG: Digeranylgeranylglycerophospholipid reductase [Promethearchaeota archaeon]|nr:MAG: Digeranylgeranylglycerophospholipid reductase [Candidatus Lokiarchaeota archaeon]
MPQENLHFDLCIIGASIAGNYLGHLLSKYNLKIAIIEEHKSVGKPLQCAGIISQKLDNLIDLPEFLVLNRVNTAKLISPSGEELEFSGEENPYIVDRIALDTYFYEKIRNSSKITYFLGEKFLSMKIKKHSKKKPIVIQTTKRKISAELIVGCDGPLSTVAEYFGVKNDLLYATQIRIQGNFNEDTAYMYFSPKWKELFGWIVPEGEKHYRIGLASANNIADNFRIFLKNIGVSKKERIDQQGGLIPYGMMNEIAFDRCLLLGDAAGQVKATTGGGIVMLLTASRFAAMCIKECFSKKIFSKKFIKRNYERPCRATIGIQLKLHYLISKTLERFTERDFKLAFRIIKREEINELVSIHGDMDFPKKIVFKLIRDTQVIMFILKFLRRNLVYSLKILLDLIRN